MTEHDAEWEAVIASVNAGSIDAAVKEARRLFTLEAQEWEAANPRSTEPSTQLRRIHMARNSPRHRALLALHPHLIKLKSAEDNTQRVLAGRGTFEGGNKP